MRIVQVAPGPVGHGVVRHATRLAGLLQEAGAEVVVQRRLGGLPDVDLVHLHFTDSLLPGGIAVAAAQVVDWMALQPRPAVVTLHDVPGTDVDAARDARRSTGYAQVAAAAREVVVSAGRELDLWPVASVVPLPIEPLAAAGPVPVWADRPSIVVLGFLYPGKGHDLGVELAPPGTVVVAAGAVSPGAGALAAKLSDRAAARGVGWHVTGPLSEADLHAAARAATVPFAAYRTPGASGSLASWLAAGRRPLTLQSVQLADLLREEPDCVRQVPVQGLGRAVADVLAVPGSTWLERPIPRPAVAELHLAVYARALAVVGASR